MTQCLQATLCGVGQGRIIGNTDSSDDKEAKLEAKAKVRGIEGEESRVHVYFVVATGSDVTSSAPAVLQDVTKLSYTDSASTSTSS